jgi:hypothetical protein
VRYGDKTINLSLKPGAQAQINAREFLDEPGI